MLMRQVICINGQTPWYAHLIVFPSILAHRTLLCLVFFREDKIPSLFCETNVARNKTIHAIP